ncbi:hypothetical protein PpBr36_02241 [Pyricularia pennisetigena]|uniref:hypothetical protein n=1 Tax=Pyricularia pennisetigena TaxID=1578925 RepID=UPI001151769C|nr:hypothetical protein PpBr36_02241 [Pyricularia pennisetigena]TLS30043.1 hypothetical protein PpBr36_02241 [Pyricularia pennisetigena]
MNSTLQDGSSAGAIPPDAYTFRLYHYDPTIPGAIVVAVIFLATTIFHFWQLIRSRCWFMIPLAVGGILEVIGYAARAKSGDESPNWTLGPYIIQAILLLVAPALFAATIYMALGRIIQRVDGESRSLVSIQWLTKIFVTGDVVSFFMQAGGGGYQAVGTLEALQNGSNIIIAGLFVQLFCFGCFVVVSVAFHMAINKQPTGRSASDIPWRKHLKALYLGSALIMVRSIFRVVEYLQGFNGYLLSHEAYLYVFDALLMMCAMMWFNWVHPGEMLSAVLGRRWHGDVEEECSSMQL